MELLNYMKSLINYINESNKVELVSTGSERGYDYVDLGLPSKTMWATCNVGAKSPEDYGLLFQFGRVDGYRYGDKNNKFSLDEKNVKDTGDIDVPQTTSGKTYKQNNILSLDDDAANVNMGGKWRMPTKDETKELIHNTKHTIETINKVKGMLFTSIINGNSIFIPFGGDWFGGDYEFDKRDGAIWSSQVWDVDDYGWCLEFNKYKYTAVEGNFRSFGLSVRGVFKK